MYQALQGNIGLGKAIEYFTSHEMTICLPLNDTQKYDLVVEINGKLSKISVKTTRTKNSESSYYVLLKNCGGSSGKSKVRLFDNKSCDYIFVLTAEDKLYLIPSAIIKAKHGIAVGDKYAEYEVHCKKFSEFNNNDTD